MNRGPAGPGGPEPGQGAEDAHSAGLVGQLGRLGVIRTPAVLSVDIYRRVQYLPICSWQGPVCGPNIAAMAELVQAGSAAIEVRGLTKSYGDVHAVRGIDLTVERGRDLRAARPERCREDDHGRDPRGLPAARRRHGQGPRLRSGAATATAEEPDRHRPAVDRSRPLPHGGRDARDVRGVLPATLGPVDEVIELVGLEDKRDTRVMKLSGGSAAAAGRRDRPGRQPGSAVPRRAHDRIRPLGPP